MKRIRIKFEAEIPEEATEEQIDEWVRFCLHERGGMSNSNPLHTHDIDALFGSVIISEY